MRRAARVELSAAERRQLTAWARRGPARGRLVLRSRIVLEAARGATNAQVAARLGVSLETAARWRSRFVLNGLEGISREAPRAGAAARVPRATIGRIVDTTLASPPAPGTRWTTRSLARSLHVNHMLVHRVWAAHGLGNRSAAPANHRVRPRVDLGGAFVTPAARALVFTVDERPEQPTGPLAMPELVPNLTASAAFSGPEALSREVVHAVEAIETARTPRGPPSESSLLVFLRGVERHARRSVRLEVIFDRPLSRLGRRVARWLDSHGRFRVFTTPRELRWSEAVDAWLRRWSSGGLDRASLARAPEFAHRFPTTATSDRHRRRLPPRFSWGPSGVVPSVHAWGTGRMLAPEQPGDPQAPAADSSPEASAVR